MNATRTMTAWVVRWQVAQSQMNDYLMPWECVGAMSFGGREDAEDVATYLRKLGVPDSHGFSNKCSSVDVAQEDVAHENVRHVIPSWVKKDRVAI